MHTQIIIHFVLNTYKITPIYLKIEGTHHDSDEDDDIDTNYVPSTNASSTTTPKIKSKSSSPKYSWFNESESTSEQSDDALLNNLSDFDVDQIDLNNLELNKEKKKSKKKKKKHKKDKKKHKKDRKKKKKKKKKGMCLFQSYFKFVFIFLRPLQI